MSAAQKLIDWRGDRSREDVAKLVPVSGVTWWRWEREESQVALPKLPRVCELTGLSKADLRPDLFDEQPAATDFTRPSSTEESAA